MEVTKGTKHSMAYRRELVAQMRLRGLSERAIVESLARSRIEVSKTTVHKDLEHLNAEWQRSAARDISELKALHMAKLEEAERAAWSQRNLSGVLSALKQQAQLLGLDAPVKTDNTHKISYADIPTADLDREIAAIVDAARARAAAGPDE